MRKRPASMTRRALRVHGEGPWKLLLMAVSMVRHSPSLSMPLLKSFELRSGFTATPSLPVLSDSLLLLILL